MKMKDEIVCHIYMSALSFTSSYIHTELIQTANDSLKHSLTPWIYCP